MQRVSSYRTDSWCDKTMSVLKEQQLEACQERLSLYPGQGLFSGVSPKDFDILWQHSYYANENTDRLIDIPSAQALVLERLKREACYLSQNEEDLLRRMLMLDGHTDLDDWEEISAAEALLSRLWCSIEVTEDRAILRIEDALISPLLEAMSSAEYALMRQKLFTFNSTIYSLLYLSGFLYASVPCSNFIGFIKEKHDRLDESLLMRYMLASYDYQTMADGSVLLVHPGLADPENMLSVLQKYNAEPLKISTDMMVGAMNGILQEERPACELMAGALRGAVRPDYEPEEVVDDLRIMAKQSAPFSEMKDVLSGMLCVLPTQNMLDCLKQLYLQTVRWAGMPSAVLH